VVGGNSYTSIIFVFSFKMSKLITALMFVCHVLLVTMVTAFPYTQQGTY